MDEEQNKRPYNPAVRSVKSRAGLGVGSAYVLRKGSLLTSILEYSIIAGAIIQTNCSEDTTISVRSEVTSYSYGLCKLMNVIIFIKFVITNYSKHSIVQLCSYGIYNCHFVFSFSNLSQIILAQFPSLFFIVTTSAAM